MAEWGYPHSAIPLQTIEAVPDMTDHTKKQLLKMASEFLRDAAVLIAVFAPLEGIVTKSLTWSGGLATLALSLFCLGFGAWLGLEPQK